MSAGKLSRFTGLVFVLAAFIGGAGANDFGAEHETGGSTVLTGGATFDMAAASSAHSIARLQRDVDWG